MSVFEHGLVAERLLSAALIASDEGEVELANAAVAETSELAQDLMVSSESSVVRKLEQPLEMPEGMRDCKCTQKHGQDNRESIGVKSMRTSARATDTKSEKMAKDFMICMFSLEPTKEWTGY